MNYELLLALLGVVTLAAAVLPRFVDRLPLSMPMVQVAMGMGLAWALPNMGRIDPVTQGVFVERLTELAVILSLTGAGLKIDRRVGWRAWGTTWRLLAITMPLSIIAITLGGTALVGWPLAAALLLAASIAPTDPVLASSVQVGPPRQGDEPETRFALTSEAGLNDGLAFPFVYLAIALMAEGWSAGVLADWLAVKVAWKIGCGIVVGWMIGAVVARLLLDLVKPAPGAQGFVALSLTLAAYGLCELAQGYGFIAVFVAALTFRDHERDHEYHETLHDFGEELENLLLAGLLLGFGVALAQGLLADLTTPMVWLAILAILVIRPLAGLAGLVGTGLRPLERAAIAALGIRGLGTFYYLAYGLNNAPFPIGIGRDLWATAGLIVLLSVILHGLWAPRLMQRSDGEAQIR